MSLPNLTPSAHKADTSLALLRQTMDYEAPYYVDTIHLSLKTREGRSVSVPSFVRLWGQRKDGRVLYLLERLGMPLDRILPTNADWAEALIEAQNRTEPVEHASRLLKLHSFSRDYDHEPRGWSGPVVPEAMWLDVSE